MVVSEQHLYQTIVLPRKLTTGSIHDYLFCYCPLVGIIFEVLRIVSNSKYKSGWEILGIVALFLIKYVPRILFMICLSLSKDIC